MKIKRIPLKERKFYLENNRAAHPEYNALLILNLAYTPLSAFFAWNPSALPCMAKLMDISEEEAGTMTYFQAAKIIDTMRATAPYCADEATLLMAEPFKSYQKERMRNNDSESEEDTA